MFPPVPGVDNATCSIREAFGENCFRPTAFTERETFASLENEPCRWWWWWWRSVLLLKKSLRGFYSRLETNSRKAPSSSPPDSSPDAVVVPGSATTRSIAAPAPADAQEIFWIEPLEPWGKGAAKSSHQQTRGLLFTIIYCYFGEIIVNNSCAIYYYLLLF